MIRAIRSALNLVASFVAANVIGCLAGVAVYALTGHNVAANLTTAAVTLAVFIRVQ